MHPCVADQIANGRRTVRLERATGVGHPVSGQPVANPVRDPRCGAPQAWVGAADAVAHRQVVIGQPFDQLRDVGGVVLTVGVQRHDDVPASTLETRRERGALTVVPIEVQAAHLGPGRRELVDCLARSVVTPVVDEQQLVDPAVAAGDGFDLVDQRDQVLAFVENRNDEGDLGHSPPPLRLKIHQRRRRRWRSTNAASSAVHGPASRISFHFSSAE